MKTIIIFLFIFTINLPLTKGQIISSDSTLEKVDFRIPIIKVLGRHMNVKRLLESPRNHSYVFSLSLSFNAAGEIDTIYFSDKMSDYLKGIIKPGDKLNEDLRAIDFMNEYKSKIVLLPIVFKRWEDSQIDNASNFLKELTALWPKLEVKDKSKQVILLDPYINLYSIIKN